MRNHPGSVLFFAVVAASMACSSSTKAGAGSTSGSITSASGGRSSGSTSGASGGVTQGSSSGSTSGATSGAGSSSGGSSGAPYDGGTRFPPTSIFYQDVSTAPLDPDSSSIISALSAAGGWGNGGVFQIDFSMTINYADPSVPALPFDCPGDPGNDAGDCITAQYQNTVGSYYYPDCDLVPVPLPPGGLAEQYPPVGNYSCDYTENDCHIFVYQSHWLYELYNATTGNGLWDGGLTAVCEVLWDLNTDYWQEPVGGWDGGNYSRGDQCTSADGAGMPISPLLVTGGELDAGYVGHAIRFILPNSYMIANKYVHPGTHSGADPENGAGGEYLPAYVSRFRLKSTFDTSQLNPGAKVVAQALMTFGMFLDDGGNIATTFDSSAQSFIGPLDLSSLQVTDFDVIAAPDVAYPGISYPAANGSCNHVPITALY